MKFRALIVKNYKKVKFKNKVKDEVLSFNRQELREVQN